MIFSTTIVQQKLKMELKLLEYQLVYDPSTL